MGDAIAISRRGLLAALGALPAARFLSGQENPKYSAGVKVVNLFATVRDKQGQVVKDLTQDDFILDEDGHPQTIRYFSRETDLPLTLGLLVDTSTSQRTVIPEERTASFRFLDKLMRPEKDKAFVVHFDYEVELLQDLTSERATLQKALDQLEIGEGRRGLARRNDPRDNGRGRGGSGGRGRGGFTGTTLYDAVFLSADEVVRHETGRKAFIILSDGVDVGSKTRLASCIESAQRRDTIVDSILYSDPEAYARLGGLGRGGGRGWEELDGKKVLEQISGETGGRMFQVSRRMPIDKVFAAIEEDLRNQYSIGYTSDRTGGEKEYRRIYLTTRRKGLVVQTREGYYPA